MSGRTAFATMLLALSAATASPASAQTAPPSYGAQPPPYGATPPYGGQGAPYGTQPQPYPPPQPGTYGAPPQYGVPTAYGYAAPRARRTPLEIGILYGTAALYGVGVGVWLGAELDIDDPATFLIFPAVLGIGAPVGVYVADTPFTRGVPAAITAGVALGAGEGFALANLQHVTADDDDAWGFRGFARATLIGATLGGIGGAVVGVAQEPSPKLSLFVSTGALWGSAIGAMYGYGATPAGIGYSRANDGAALGGLIGYNAGLVATAALSTLYVPSYTSLGWMWAGGAIGFAASLPVYLFYLGDDRPPAKRGLIFSATATLLGVGAGALFTSGTRDSAASPRSSFAKSLIVHPVGLPGGMGLGLSGEL